MEKIHTSEKWLKKYEEVKNLLTSPVNYAQCFEMKEIQGKEVCVLDMGEVNFPTGEILVRDPLVCLHRDEKPYLQSVPVGKFRIKTLVVNSQLSAIKLPWVILNYQKMWNLLTKKSI